MDALTTYKLFAANSERTLDRLSNSPTISREVEYYKNNIGSIASAEELVSDQRLLNFALKAYGLEEMGYAKAFMEKLLKDGVDDREALANQLADPRYKEFAKDFNFAQFGSATTSFERTQSGVTNKFLQQTLEQEAGNQNTGARLAIYFERKSADIEDAFSILGDPALLQVVQTSFGFPAQMSLLPIDRQAEMINERLDIEDLTDPEFMSDLTTRFLALWDVNNPTIVSVPPLISQPFGSQQTLTLDILASIQNLRSR
jgi:hypothetical protein